MIFSHSVEKYLHVHREKAKKNPSYCLDKLELTKFYIFFFIKVMPYIKPVFSQKLTKIDLFC